MLRSLTRLSVLLSAVGVLYLGCGGEGTTDPPPEDPEVTQAVAAAGNGQTGVVGQPLAGPLVVQINDQSGNPMTGINVSFTVSAGGGSVSSTSGTTDAVRAGWIDIRPRVDFPELERNGLFLNG